MTTNELTEGFDDIPYGSLKSIKIAVSKAARKRGCIQNVKEFVRGHGRRPKKRQSLSPA